MQTIKWFFSILILLFFISPSFLFSQSSQRQEINFDRGWKFHFGHAANPEKDFNYSIVTVFSKSGGAARTAIDPFFKDSSWRNLNLPHDWAVELPFVNVDNFDVESHGYKPVGGLFPETSIGWYRKHFNISKEDSGKRFQIQFDGIFRDANIWVNGFYLGNNKSGYVGVAYDITDFINFEKDNVLVVRVDATQYEGWFYEGAGIYRHVWLNKYPNLHIATNGMFAYSMVQRDKATVTVETSVANENNSTASCTVSSFVTDRDGKIVSKSETQSVSLDINEEKISKQNIVVTNPRLWSIEDPYLYRVVVEVKSSGKIIDTKTLRFGIRTVDIKN